MSSTQIVCKTCKRPLTSLVDSQGATYLHGLYDLQEGDARDGHAVVPVVVATSDVLMRCDFCHDELSGDDAWVVRVEPFTFLGQGNGDWGACARCARLVERERWGQLVEIATQVHKRVLGLRRVEPEIIAIFRELYREVQRHKRGPVLPPAASAS